MTLEEGDESGEAEGGGGEGGGDTAPGSDEGVSEADDTAGEAGM